MSSEKEVGNEEPVKPKKVNKLKKGFANTKEKSKKRKSEKKQKKDFLKYHDKDGKVLTTINNEGGAPTLDLLDKLEKGTFTNEDLGIKESKKEAAPENSKDENKIPTWAYIVAAVIVLLIIIKVIFK